MRFVPAIDFRALPATSERAAYPFGVDGAAGEIHHTTDRRVKFYNNGVWYNDLMRRVRLNDLLNNIRQTLAEYRKHQNRRPRS